MTDVTVVFTEQEARALASLASLWSEALRDDARSQLPDGPCALERAAMKLDTALVIEGCAE